MRVAYVEMIGGASGNMLLGALIDAGADPDAIERALRTIPVSGWKLERSRSVKGGLAAAYVDFDLPGEDCRPGEMVAHGHHLGDILDIIERSGLSARVRKRASAIYRRLGEAEARVHGTSVDAIHFHEVGQIDAVLDVAGVCVALELLGIERVMCSPFPLGRGSISMHHGRYPNPPPATAELLRGAPTQPLDVDGELVTTTAAAILSTLVTDPGVRPAMRFERIGYGAGRSDFAVPNVTRIIIGELMLAAERPADVAAGNDLMSDEVVVLEANIDDMSPQAFELAIERIFAAGAFDVWTAPVAMKKQRPAVLLSALAPPAAAAACARAMLRETSSIGVRTRRESRYTLPREIVRRLTPLGEVRCKHVRGPDGERVTLEYDDVARIARERNLPFAQVVEELTRYVQSVEATDERNLV
jgi:pyridinium-3,5-bisthiocarboxylic acid mononucleotide nickel chelatase